MPTANSSLEAGALVAAPAGTMAAAVYRGAKTVAVEQIPVPEIGPGEILKSFFVPIVQDAIAEAWVRTGGGSLAFVQAEARAVDGTLAATASLVFRVRPRDGR